MLPQLKKKEVFKTNSNDLESFFDCMEVNYFSGLDSSKFKLLGNKNNDTYYRFTIDECESIKDVNEGVWWLARNSSGVKLRFITNSRVIKIKVKINETMNVYNMPFISKLGFDLYYFDEVSKKYKYNNSSIPINFKDKEYESILGVFQEKKDREIIIHFPLYSGVDKLEIGIEKDSFSIPLDYENKNKIVAYGTSILQGAAVSHPGLNITNVLSRYYNQDVLNFGFSGNGYLELEIAKIISSIKDIEILIIDAFANAGCETYLEDNLEAFIDEFYSQHKDLKIIIMNKTYMTINEIYPRNERLRKYYNNFLKRVVNKYKNKGKNIIYVDNNHIFNKTILDESELLVDGVHPNDLGMYYLTLSYIKSINKIKGESYEGKREKRN